MSRAKIFALILMLSAAGCKGCVKTPPKALDELRTRGWQLEQLDILVTARKPDCTDADLATLAEHAKDLERLEVEIGGSQVTDAGLAHIHALNNVVKLDASRTVLTLAPFARMTSLETLNMTGTSTDDTSLAHLARLTKLNLLVLDSCEQITGAGLGHLRTLQNLESLKLNNTAVNDAGLATLPPLPKLRRLFLNGTKITDASLTHFKTLPALDEVGLENVVGMTEGALDAFEEANEQIQVNR